MLVPKGGDEGADGDVHYVAVEQDLDKNLEGPKASFANKGKPRFIINSCWLNYATISIMLVHLRFRSW
jgi:hypothetical protein